MTRRKAAAKALEVTPAETRHSAETERAVVACVLLDPRLLDEVLLWVEPGDLWAADARIVFSAMLRLREAQLPIDLRTLQEDLERRGELEVVGGVVGLATLDEMLPDIGRCEAYCRIVRRDSLARQAARLARQAIARLETVEEPGDVRDELLQCSKLLDDAVSVEVGAVTMTEMVVTARSRLAQVQAGERDPGLAFGFPSIDAAVVGLAPRDLCVVGGYAGDGKTSFVEQLAWTWVGRGHRVVFLSLEMARAQEEDRIVARLVRSPLTAVRRGHISFDRLDAWIADPSRHEEGDRLVCAFPRSNRLDVVLGAARTLAAEHQPHAIVVDHIHRVSARASDRRMEVDQVVRALKSLAVELEVPVVAPAQIGRAARRSGQPPQESDLYESAAIEQEADVILLIYRPSDEVNAQAAVAKARQGERRDWSRPIELVWDERTRSLSELESRYEPPPARQAKEAGLW